MKLYRVFLIVLMTSAFAVLGCGDSGSDASSACASCPEARKEVCEIDYNDCIQVGGTQAACENAVRADCLL
jgi:hypothetical protein